MDHADAGNKGPATRSSGTDGAISAPNAASDQHTEVACAPMANRYGGECGPGGCTRLYPKPSVFPEWDA